MLRLICLLAILGAVLFFTLSDSKISAKNWSTPSGRVLEKLKKDPVQKPLSPPQTIRYKDATISFVATYDITARVLSKKTYRFDEESKYSPIDLALGWGDMSSHSSFNQLKISQSNRYYIYKWGSDGLPIPLQTIINTSANVHLIPKDESVLKTLKKVKPGQIVSMQGYLVQISQENGWLWKTSVTRSDKGNGACELMYVENVQIF